MSTGTRLEWLDAAAIASQLLRDLTPAVQRVKIVGSVRRCRPNVGDVEMLAEPHMMTAGLFGEQAPDLDSVRDVAGRWGQLKKNGSRFIQVELVGGVHVDLFLCSPPAQWGSLLAIRTGPRELGELAVTRMQVYGLKHERGHVVRAATGEIVPTPREEDFFAAAGLPCLPPRLRDTPAAFRPLDELTQG